MAREILDDRNLRRRFESMMACIESPDIEALDHAGVERTLGEIGPRQSLRRGGIEGLSRTKDLVAFTTFRGDEDVFPGYSWREMRSARRERRRNGVRCQTAVEIQSVVGCPFDCAYCPYSSFVCLRLDVETFAERVTELTRERRSQRLYKLNNRTDTLALEPEYELATTLVSRFAELEGGYLLLYTKGASVDHLVDLDHRGKTVASFTLTPKKIAETLEAGAATTKARLGAIEKLARAGYPVRVRFSPIIPFRGWREVYRELINDLARACTPEMVTLWTLSMIPLDDLFRIVPEEALDADALEAARRHAASMKGIKGAPFPAELRAAIYGEIAAMVRAASPSTLVSLCLEAPRVWSMLADSVVPLRRGRFLCNCGPRATPEALSKLR